MSSESLHENPASLGTAVLDRHRAIASLMEEFEAVDWYDQRAAATDDEDLRAILVHNRDEEKEHAAMILEWLRRHDTALNAQLRRYLFRVGPIDRLESAPSTPGADGSLGIGSLRVTMGASNEPSVP